jgi:hypothetical protein
MPARVAKLVDALASGASFLRMCWFESSRGHTNHPKLRLGVFHLNPRLDPAVVEWEDEGGHHSTPAGRAH